MTENTDKKCACSGANLGKFIQPIILKILHNEPCNGYQLIKKMENYATFLDTKPDPTGIYRYLKAMQEKGLIDKDDENYSLTAAGKDCFDNWKKTLANYLNQLNKLIIELDN